MSDSAPQQIYGTTVLCRQIKLEQVEDFHWRTGSFLLEKWVKTSTHLHGWIGRMHSRWGEVVGKYFDEIQDFYRIGVFLVGIFTAIRSKFPIFVFWRKVFLQEKENINRENSLFIKEN